MSSVKSVAAAAVFAAALWLLGHPSGWQCPFVLVGSEARPAAPAWGALEQSPSGAEQGGQPPRRFGIYRDADSKTNAGHWTGFMPEEAAKMLKLNLACRDDPNAGETCIRVDIEWLRPYWVGLAVASQPDYWGEKEKKPAFNLRGAKRLVFHARGAVGGEYIQVKCAITGDKPFGDSAKHPAESEWIKLGKGWNQYEVDLTGYDLSRVVTPFVFVSNRDHNPRGGLTVFFDDIYIEY